MMLLGLQFPLRFSGFAPNSIPDSGGLVPEPAVLRFLDFGNLFVRQGIAQRIGQFFRFVFAVVGFCVEIRHGECGFVDAPPIVFQLSASPTALEFGFSGVFSGGVVEIP